MIPYAIYIIDDEQTIREGVGMALEGDYRVETFSTAEAAIEAMESGPPDLVLLDIGLPGMDGITALGIMKGRYPDMMIIMITAYEEISTVISAMKSGAYDYVVKPLHMDSLVVTIRNALETIRLRKEVQTLQENYLKENFPCFIGESKAIQDVMEFIGMVAKSPDTPILILGETGTGKELLASAIHYRSPDFKGPFMTVNCAAIPKDLIESELFGYEKGAFSGANASGKRGLIEEAADGTLFLDEVGDLSLEAQAKLLRFLEEGEFYRVGETKKQRIQTRVVSATNKDLDGMLEKGTFRKDLYFRLGVIKVQVPSLNDRRDDILPIARHFLYEFSRKFDKIFSHISPKAESALMAYNWTGNVRELKNMIERAVLIGNGPALEDSDLGIAESREGEPPTRVKNEMAFPPLPATGIDLPALGETLDKHYIEAALRMAEGNESKAAKLLNMNHHTFRYHRKKLQTK
ncbi:MAG: sigma-54-dependent Fis family transcriptional regulator [Deltaproteobacteria bacterium]|nr:sigma-54-dependent Fis family transcriptional regulator [Deltaproteobacteria bacterium]